MTEAKKLKAAGAIAKPCSRSNLTNVSMTKPTAKHRGLGIFAGKWITQGTIRATEGSASAEMRAIDRYEWLPGGFFMLHKVDALIGGTVSQSIEVIGYDKEQACYVTRSYDDQGMSDGFTAHLKGSA